MDQRGDIFPETGGGGGLRSNLISAGLATWSMDALAIDVLAGNLCVHRGSQTSANNANSL